MGETAEANDFMFQSRTLTYNWKRKQSQQNVRLREPTYEGGFFPTSILTVLWASGMPCTLGQPSITKCTALTSCLMTGLLSPECNPFLYRVQVIALHQSGLVIELQYLNHGPRVAVGKPTARYNRCLSCLQGSPRQEKHSYAFLSRRLSPTATSGRIGRVDFFAFEAHDANCMHEADRPRPWKKKSNSYQPVYSVRSTQYGVRGSFLKKPSESHKNVVLHEWTNKKQITCS